MSAASKPIIVKSGNAAALANYPHARLITTTSYRTLYISGTSCRRPDGTFDGVHANEDGSLRLDIEEQTHAVLSNIENIIKEATNGRGGLENVVDATIFLIDVEKHYQGMNEVWNRFWPRAADAPARTTVGVRELPNPKLIIEIKATAVVEVDGS